MQHVSFQIALQREFLQAYEANISVDACVHGDVIVVVRASAENPAAHLTQVPVEFLVDALYVFIQAANTAKGAEALWACEQLVRVLHPRVTLQLALVAKHRLAIRTLVFMTVKRCWATFLFWFDKRVKMSCRGRCWRSAQSGRQTRSRDNSDDLAKINT